MPAKQMLAHTTAKAAARPHGVSQQGIVWLCMKRHAVERHSLQWEGTTQAEHNALEWKHVADLAREAQMFWRLPHESTQQAEQWRSGEVLAGAWPWAQQQQPGGQPGPLHHCQGSPQAPWQKKTGGQLVCQSWP